MYMQGISFNVSLCVGGLKGKVGIQIRCIPEKRDTSRVNFLETMKNTNEPLCNTIKIAYECASKAP